MHTLEEIYDKIADIASPQALSATSTVVHAGFYVSTDLTLVDGDLLAENVKHGVTMFGIDGTLSPSYAAGVPKTGQTSSYTTGDDGFYQTGVASPAPRFTVGTGSASNCVTDHKTGLMWLRNPDSAQRNWYDSITYCEGLTGSDGRGGFSDWRMPNIRELLSLTDYSQSVPALPLGHPFEEITADYWSSTTKTYDTDDAWYWRSFAGSAYMQESDKNSYHKRAWPVRVGQ